MIEGWKNVLLEKSQDWGLPTGNDWHFLLHNNYHPHYSNINLLWFYGSENWPRVVTKIFPEPSIPEREFENLIQVSREIPTLVPRPLQLTHEGRFWALWMTGIAGSRPHPNDSHSPATLRSLGETVLSMQLAMRKERSLFGADRYRRIVSDPINTLASFGDSSVVHAGCRCLEAEIQVNWLDRLPAIPQHGDLFFGNLLSSGKIWYVLDWEAYGITDLPLYDLFTLSLSLLLARGPVPERWPPSLATQIRNIIRACAGNLGLSQPIVRLLLPLSLVNWFHVQWKDGRKQFADTMYATIEKYFARRQAWDNALVCP
jgi:hypothetical protein